MTSHFQQIHNLKQEVKRLRFLLLEVQSEYQDQVKALKHEIINPRVDFNDAPNHWKEVLRAVCTVTELTPDEILCPSRKRASLYARHMFNFICRKRLGMPWVEIGRIIHRDHSTAINSVNEFSNILHTDKEVQRRYAKVCVLLNEALEV
jgi:chromosomal replication initiation ATPase DnaA